MHCAQKNKTRRRTHIDFPCFVSYIAPIQTIAVSSNSYFYYTLITYKLQYKGGIFPPSLSLNGIL